jgi:glutathione synthase
VVVNQAAGYLLRTKSASVDEGGVAAGYAHLDAPALF